MTGSECYKLFGLNPGASEEEIRKKYRVLAKKHHPDVNKDEKSTKRFLEIQEAYEFLLQDILRPEEVDEVQVPETSLEEDYAVYRAHAAEQYRARKLKEEKELQAMYERLQSGPTFLFHRIIAVACIIVLVALLLDLFLPHHIEKSVIESYSTDVYQSMNDNLVSLAKTQSGDRFFLNAFSNRYFDTNPFVDIERTNILHQAVHVISDAKDLKQIIPIHFSFYWAQAVLFFFFLIPSVFLWYRKKDAFFIMGSYFSRYGSGILLLYFLMTEGRWYHLLTLGFY